MKYEHEFLKNFNFRDLSIIQTICMHVLVHEHHTKSRSCAYNFCNWFENFLRSLASLTEYVLVTQRTTYYWRVIWNILWVKKKIPTLHCVSKSRYRAWPASKIFSKRSLHDAESHNFSSACNIPHGCTGLQVQSNFYRNLKTAVVLELWNQNPILDHNASCFHPE